MIVGVTGVGAGQRQRAGGCCRDESRGSLGPFEPGGAGADLQLTPAPGLTTTEARNAAKQGLGPCTKVHAGKHLLCAPPTPPT